MQFLKKARKVFDVLEVEDQDRPVFSREGLFLYVFTGKTRHTPALARASAPPPSAVAADAASREES